MKFILFSVALLLAVKCYSQSLELSVSNPQPRLGQKFTLSINTDTLTTKLFGFLSSKFKIESAKNALGSLQTLSVDVWATKIGENEIPPLTIDFNGVKYVTNKISFKVVDTLPPVDKGFWIREVPINDTTFYVLIEQRTPATRYTENAGNSINISTRTNDEEKEGQMAYEHAKNVKFDFNEGNSEMQTINIPNSGKELTFKYSFWRYKLIIIDKNKPVVLVRSDFQDLPDYYKFKDIVVN